MTSELRPGPMSRPLIRVLEAGLGPDAQVRLVVSGPLDLDRLRAVWVSSGAAVAPVNGRLHATTTVAALARAAGRAFGAEQARRMEAALREAIAAWSDAAPALSLRSGAAATDVRPLIMGVVNVTPDSFSDGGSLYPDGHPERAIAHARGLVAAGADLIDVGGESSRPGAVAVEESAELDRVLPVVEALSAEGIVTSVDTTKPAVAEAALNAGAGLVNDVSGGNDADLLAVTAAAGAGYVLMHSRGTPATMGSQTGYTDVVAEVYEYLARGLDRVTEAGIDVARVVVDPGLGFAKEPEHNLALLRATRQLRGLGRPVLVGASRKSFLGMILGSAEVSERLEGSLACAVFAVTQGASIVRVHDVAPTLRAVRVAHAVHTGDTAWEPALRS